MAHGCPRNFTDVWGLLLVRHLSVSIKIEHTIMAASGVDQNHIGLACWTPLPTLPKEKKRAWLFRVLTRSTYAKMSVSRKILTHGGILSTSNRKCVPFISDKATFSFYQSARINHRGKMIRKQPEGLCVAARNES